MAGVDASIYQMFKPVDLFGSYQRGVQARQQQEAGDREAQDQKWKSEAQKVYGLGVVQNPDGSTSYNPAAALTGIKSADQNNPYIGKMAYDLGQNMYGRDQDAQKLKDAQEQRVIDNELRRQQIEATRANTADSRATRAEQKVEADVQKLSKEISGAQGSIDALDEVENLLGFKLEEASTPNGKLQVGGKTKDLPGVSIPLLGRVSAYSNDAQNLESAAGKVFNTVLKDRSGAAVSNSEMERLKTEFGQGKYNTEPQLVGALQRYKRAVETELQNRQAGFRPEIVETYADRGGRTLKAKPSDPIAPKSGKVVDGYRFKGGDPGDQNNWEKI